MRVIHHNKAGIRLFQRGSKEKGPTELPGLGTTARGWKGRAECTYCEPC
jgi:hypothetical protein